MSDLRELYQEVILDHNKHPQNFGELEGADRHADGFNPLCGDRISVYLKIDGEVLNEVNFLGSGCAISKASASLMTEAVKGKRISEAHQLLQHFHQMITDNTVMPDPVVLGKLAVFIGVRDYPTRVKCATLAWHTLRAAFEDDRTLVATE
jgi:nitrogen fixation NifU-like protein